MYMSKGVEQKRSKEVIVDRMRKEEIQEGGDSAKGNVLGKEYTNGTSASKWRMVVSADYHPPFCRER